MKLLKYIFSIENSSDKSHKIIYILGIKFKYNRYETLKRAKIKLKKNKIVFCNYFGKNYGCNPKYITEEIIKRNLPYELVWLVNDKKTLANDFPKEIRLENLYSPNGMKEILTSKVMINNTRYLPFWEKGYKKNKNQFYIQTWHGSLGIKKMEGDIENEHSWYRKLAKLDSQNIDIITANSRFLYDLYSRESCFWYKGKIIKTGNPRNDILFKKECDKQAIIDKVYSYLKIKKDEKIILYVPTFRDDGDIDCLNIDSEKVRKIIENKFDSDYKFVIRLHPSVPPKEKEKFAGMVNATSYPDVQELLLASDIVISDYSSCMFDFMLTRHPVFIYASDIEKYNTDRGFYYPLESTPFPIATNNEEMIENIKNFDYDKYKQEVDKFLIDKGCVDDGHASERVVEIIKEFIEGK